MAKGSPALPAVDPRGNTLPVVTTDPMSVVRWWETRDPGDLCVTTNLLAALQDLQKVCVQHVMLRMLDEKTPQEQKDKIALQFIPKLTTELRGRLPAPDGAGPGGSVQGLLQTYRVG